MISICLLRQLKAQLLSSHLPHKFAQTAQIQVANISRRSLCFQTVTILVDSSQVKSASDKIGKLHDDLAFYEERHGCQLCFISFSRAADTACSFRLIVQLHRLIHIRKWTKYFTKLLFKSNNLCGSGSGRIFALPLPQKKDRFRFQLPLPHPC